MHAYGDINFQLCSHVKRRLLFDLLWQQIILYNGWMLSEEDWRQ